SGSERSIQLGGSYIVNGSCFPEKAQYVALGHVHKTQVVPGTNKKVRYSGAPLHYNKKEISFVNKCFLVDVKAGEEAKIGEVEFKVYKPIEIWKCDSIEAAIERCEENKDRECWVYLEVSTDRYISEEEIKKMKAAKKDILEILPKLKGTDEESESAASLADKPFHEIFKEFYKKERGVEAQEEVVELLMSILSEEGDN
ncbi:MAG: exonuclease SbcCD subunit D C-terminal domain-containing protein, partial [Clostridium sp.]